MFQTSGLIFPCRTNSLYLQEIIFQIILFYIVDIYILYLDFFNLLVILTLIVYGQSGGKHHNTPTGIFIVLVIFFQNLPQVKIFFFSREGKQNILSYQVEQKYIFP